MIQILRSADLFEGLDEQQLESVENVAQSTRLANGEFLFRLGDPAKSLYVVADGVIDLCFPLPLGDEVRDITIETIRPGRTLGWSALVRPYRFTLSARASGSCLVLAFPRPGLLELFDEDPRLGYRISTRVSELVGLRLISVQALWVRGVRRAFETETHQGTR